MEAKTEEKVGSMATWQSTAVLLL